MCDDSVDRMRMMTTTNPQCQKELHKAVARGRFMVREMVGIIQLKKYRTMKQRYGDDEATKNSSSGGVLQQAMQALEKEQQQQPAVTNKG